MVIKVWRDMGCDNSMWTVNIMHRTLRVHISSGLCQLSTAALGDRGLSFTSLVLFPESATIFPGDKSQTLHSCSLAAVTHYRYQACTAAINKPNPLCPQWSLESSSTSHVCSNSGLRSNTVFNIANQTWKDSQVG